MGSNSNDDSRDTSNVQMNTKDLTVSPADVQTEKNLREKTKHIGREREAETEEITKEVSQQK